MNARVPVLVTYPNGTGFSGADVSVAELVRESNDDTVRYEPGVTTTSDTHGMAFLEVNLTVDPEESSASDTGTYTIVPGIRTDQMSSAEPLDIWKSPRFSAELYSVETDTYQSATVGLTSERSKNSSQMEASTAFRNVPNDDVGQEYRYAINVSEASLGQDCFDLDDSGDCDAAHVLLYNSSDDPEAGMDINEGLVADTPDLDGSVDSFDAGSYQANEFDSLYNATRNAGQNSSSVYAGSPSISLPRGFMVFNETTDNATVYRDRWEPSAERSLTLGLVVTDLYDAAAPEQVNVTVLDDSGAVAATKNTSARWGTALVELEPWELGVAPESMVSTSDDPRTFTWDGTTFDVEVTNVTESAEATFVLSGQTTVMTEPVPEGTTFSYSGVTLHVTDIVSTGGGSGTTTVAIKEWSTDAFLEIRGHVSSRTSEQPFSTYVGFE